MNIGSDCFDEMLERIRDIRSSEKRFYQKIRDIYKLAVDYDSRVLCIKLLTCPIRGSKMKRRSMLAKISGGVAVSLAAGCSKLGFIPGKKHRDFKIVGYFPSYRGTPREEQLSQLTHIIFSFATPTAEGGLINTIKNLREMVEAAHRHGVKAGLAIGGGSYGDGDFPAIAASADKRGAFLDACMGEVDRFELDGIDLDWEYPNKGDEAEKYALLMGEFAQALHARGKFLSSAVTDNDWPGSIAPDSSVLEDVDFLNVMAYDRGTPHSPYKLAEDSIRVWCGIKGLAKEKFMLGVPFYARSPMQTTYARIVFVHPEAANEDGVAGFDYNGKPTIIQKTKLALEQAGGIMIWEIGQDAPGEASLLTTIHDTVRK
ncbi:MAG: RhuM family protein [Candidatus Latescibacterota bacterium]